MVSGGVASPFDPLDSLQFSIGEIQTAVEEAEAFARANPADEVGCLYWNATTLTFEMPDPTAARPGHFSPHYGRPFGVLPQVETGAAFDAGGAQS